LSGALLMLAGAAGGVGGGVVIPSPTPVWSAIYGQDTAVTNNQTIGGITAPMSISAANSGGGTLIYILNGTSSLYTGAFTVHAGDVLAWSIAVGLTTESGTITVTNASDGGATLATIAYVVRSSGGGGGRGALP